MGQGSAVLLPNSPARIARYADGRTWRKRSGSSPEGPRGRNRAISSESADNERSGQRQPWGFLVV